MFVVRFMGGFANQLFQYALYLKLKENHKDNKIYADISSYKVKSLHGGFKLGEFEDFQYFEQRIDDSFKRITEENLEFASILDSENYYFDGYWQSANYLPSDLTKIRDIFHEKLLTGDNSSYLEAINSSYSVSLHVRRGDYEHDVILGNVATACFYQNAIYEVIKNNSNVHFFVFSDDIDWCRDNLDYKDADVTFVTGNDSKVHLDIALMSRCKDNIISNSSFSWWASYLNENTNKKIYMPEYWFNEPNSVSEITVNDAITLPNTPLIVSKMENPLFTIIVKAGGCRDYIKRCMSTVLNQIYDNIQVIAECDDETKPLLDDYKNRDARITYDKDIKGKYILYVNGSDFLDLTTCQQLSKEIDGRQEIIQFDVYMKPGYVHYSAEDKIHEYLDGVLKEYNARPVMDKCYPAGKENAKDIPVKHINKELYYYVTSAYDNYKAMNEKLCYRKEDHTLIAKVKRKISKIING